MLLSERELLPGSAPSRISPKHRLCLLQLPLRAAWHMKLGADSASGFSRIRLPRGCETSVPHHEPMSVRRFLPLSCGAACNKGTSTMLHGRCSSGLASPPSPNQPRVPHLATGWSPSRRLHTTFPSAARATPQAIAERGRKPSLVSNSHRTPIMGGRIPGSGEACELCTVYSMSHHYNSKVAGQQHGGACGDEGKLGDGGRRHCLELSSLTATSRSIQRNQVAPNEGCRMADGVARG